jgi:hypothetical protein
MGGSEGCIDGKFLFPLEDTYSRPEIQWLGSIKLVIQFLLQKPSPLDGDSNEKH